MIVYFFKNFFLNTNRYVLVGGVGGIYVCVRVNEVEVEGEG